MSGDPNFDSGTSDYDIWSPLTINAPSGTTIASLSVAGYANYTGIDNLDVCQSPAIASVEVTQAIQQYQTLADLKTSLQANGEPPVPIIAGKQAALRTYFNPVQSVSNITLKLSGVSTSSQSLALQPNCQPQDQRAHNNNCPSVDFYFTPPSGSWTATLDVLDSSGNVLEEEALPFKSRSTNALRLLSASICYAKDASGNWSSCGDPLTVFNTISMLKKLAPSSNVYEESSGIQTGADLASFASGNGTYDVDRWQDDALKALNDDRAWGGNFLDYLLGRRTTYFGVVLPAPQFPDTPETDTLYPFGGDRLHRRVYRDRTDELAAGELHGYRPVCGGSRDRPHVDP